jgi:anti-sigma factor RsiW
MAAGEQDIDLIERYLDDALEMGEVEALRARLADDPELVAALERVRSERALRKAVYTAYEPDDAAVSRVVGYSTNLVRQGQRSERWRGGVRYVLAAAACVAMGFFGRGLLDRVDGNAPAEGGNPVAAGTGHVDVEKVSSYRVTLRDEEGRVVAVQRFDSIEKAREFATDVARWQSHSERLASGRFVLTADRF